MKIVDMHLHTHSIGLKPDTQKLVSELNKAGTDECIAFYGKFKEVML